MLHLTYIRVKIVALNVTYVTWNITYNVILLHVYMLHVTLNVTCYG